MRHTYTKEILEPLIRESSTWADVCRALGVRPMTGAQTHVKKRSVEFEIDFSHFTGRASNKGRTFGSKRPIEYYLTRNSTIKSDSLKKRLIREGLKEAMCELCGITKWNEQPAPLELDHINRDHNDNRIKNLQILCPNCHSQKTNKDRRAGLA